MRFGAFLGLQLFIELSGELKEILFEDTDVLEKLTQQLGMEGLVDVGRLESLLESTNLIQKSH